MKAKLFDTVFETSLRLTILLNELDGDVSADYIQAIDFMALYGKCFSISDRNINGDNPFMFSEHASRRELVRSALKNLVLKGYVIPTATENGFVYRSTFEGSRFAEEQLNAFAESYRRTIQSALDVTSALEEDEVVERLRRRTRSEIERLPE